MSIISRTGDLFYAFRFLKLLVTPWDKTDAFELGILDEKGKVLKKASTLDTSEEKSAYTIFHRLVFNIKRLLGLLPFGKTKLASWATAIFLIREETGMSEEAILKVLKKMDATFNEKELTESSTWYLNENEELMSGIYTLQNDCVSHKTGETIAFKGTKIKVNEALEPIGYSLGSPMFQVYHLKTKQEIFINSGEIIR
tara:strand:+ start:736 stop:1329 length:594 start_codon:yes stop_codon:yes gene_type:complete